MVLPLNAARKTVLPLLSLSVKLGAGAPMRASAPMAAQGFAAGIAARIRLNRPAPTTRPTLAGRRRRRVRISISSIQPLRSPPATEIAAGCNRPQLWPAAAAPEGAGRCLGRAAPSAPHRRGSGRPPWSAWACLQLGTGAGGLLLIGRRG